MENLIVIEGKNKYQYKNLKSLVMNFVNKNYYNMTQEDKEKELEKKAVANTMLTNIKIINLNKNKTGFDENSFILYDEITYLLSLLKFYKIILLEKKDANIFGKYIDKTNVKDNYIILNKFVDEIIKNYLREF